MPIRPKFLHVLGLGLRTAGVEWRLRRRGNGRAEQDSAFAALLPRLALAHDGGAGRDLERVQPVEELLQLRLRKATGAVENSARFRFLRADIARCLTVLKAKATAAK